MGDFAHLGAEAEGIIDAVYEGAAQWEERCRSAEHCLSELLEIKRHKTLNGKDYYYRTWQPLAWQKAQKHFDFYNIKQLPMSEVTQPTVGRIVHVFLPPHGLENHLKHPININGAEVLPAIVTQVFGNTKCNMNVFTPDVDNPVVPQFSVDHKSEAREGYAYWDWPAIGNVSNKLFNKES